MQVIICYGNELRGEDGFGIEVAKYLASKPLINTKIITLHQLVPEIVLELLNATKIVFVDASYDKEYTYKLACSITKAQTNTFTHHINHKQIISLLNDVYNTHPDYEVVSMLCNNFDEVGDMAMYMECVRECGEYLG